MNATFNLCKEKWIPVLRADGKADEINLKEAFADAHRIKEISDPSPLVVAALYRLMLAILYQVSPVFKKQKWQEWWQVGSFDAAGIAKYLAKWEGHFDLFDAERPFYQCRFPKKMGLTEKDEQPVTKLTFAEAAGNNPTLFDHSAETTPRPFSPASVARYLITYQAFTPSAGKSKTIHTKDAPLARSYVVVAKGENLFETIMLNFVPIPAERIPLIGDDAPIWEQDKWKPAHDVRPRGVADYLTWPSRAIELIPDNGEVGPLTVTHCFLAQGKHIKESAVYEPASGFSKGEKDGIETIRPWRIDENKAVWRDCDVLLTSVYDNRAFYPPLVLNWLAQHIADGLLPAKTRLQLELIGLCTESGQPKIHFWRRERFPLPLAYLDGKTGKPLVDDLRKGLALAEEVSWRLRYNLNRLAELLLAPTADNAEGRKPLKEDVTKLSASFGAERVYWSRLEEPFLRLLQDVPGPKRKTEPEPLVAWAAELKKAAGAAFDEVTEGIGDSARALKAAAVAESRFHNELWFGVKDKKGDVVWAGLKLYLGKPEETKEVTNAKE